MVSDVFCNRLDPSSREGLSAKLAFDATRPLVSENERAVVPADAIARAQALLAQN
jgi:2,5-furandicarboxylate decarboxylase 1